MTVVLIGITYFNYRSQLSENGYAHLSVLWLVILALLVLMTVGITVQWFGSRRDKTRKGKP